MIEPSLRPKGAVMVPSKGRTAPFAMARYSLVSVSGNDERIVLTAVFDNLGKGASGAALECLNLVMGKEKGFGLEL